MSLQTIFVAGSSQGLKLDQKPYLLPDQAFSTLENAYVWRDRVKKREGIDLLGRLRRTFTSINYFVTGASPWSFNILTISGYVSTANNANPGQVTTKYPHGLTTGDLVIITGIVGATGYNNVTFTITVTGTSTFTVGVDAGAFGAYVSGGFWISNRPLTTRSGSVSTANNANPGQVTTTSPHFLSNGNQVIITEVQGATGYNNTIFTITVVNATNFTIGVSAAGFGTYTSGGIWTTLGTSVNTPEPYSEIFPGSVVIVFGGITFTDQGNGLLTSPTPGNSGTINYISGSITLTHTAGASVATVLTYSYYPSLPVMGVRLRETNAINEDVTIWFDTKYAYTYNGTIFSEFIVGTTWSGTDADFFWTANYRGILPSDRLMFTTNFVSSSTNPMRYTDGSTWTTFNPYITFSGVPANDQMLFQAKIIIPYYGRLLCLNVWEGTEANSYSGALNIANRCRFSQVGSPLEVAANPAPPAPATGAFRTDIFGKGGFVDAPTSEAIISAIFYKNTLIVGFERSTWQLRYVGDYGIPFIWERISSDFGTESTFSQIIFDQGVASVGHRAIISSNGYTVQRIDTQIPDIVFTFLNRDFGPQRVQGIRDFQRELVFWSYPQSNNLQSTQYFPNNVLVWNYRNNTYAIFRDNVTAFGIFQALPADAVSWDSLDVFWDDEDVLWDDAQTQSAFPLVAIGNQQGFCHTYGYQTINDASLSITAIDRSTTPPRLTIPNHNLSIGDLIYVTGMTFTDAGLLVITDLNQRIFRVDFISKDVVEIYEWDTSTQDYEDNFSYVPVNGTGTYVGGGQAALFPILNVVTKDFNPFQSKGSEIFLSSVGFLVDNVPESSMSIKLYADSSIALEANILAGNTDVEMSNPTGTGFFNPSSDYSWHRFYCTLSAQYIRIGMTYDNDLLNDITTHQSTWVLNSILVFAKKAGKLPF